MSVGFCRIAVNVYEYDYDYDYEYVLYRICVEYDTFWHVLALFTVFSMLSLFSVSFAINVRFDRSLR